MPPQLQQVHCTGNACACARCVPGLLSFMNAPHKTEIKHAKADARQQAWRGFSLTRRSQVLHRLVLSKLVQNAHSLDAASESTVPCGDHFPSRRHPENVPPETYR